MMKQVIFAALALGLLTSCSSRKLSADECGTLIDKEIDFAVSVMPPDAEDWFRKSHADDRADLVAKCVARKTHRKYYNCMSKANDPSTLRKCVMDEGRRNK
ncbi:hypothetical protein EJMOOK_13175 [Rhodanobacter sp. Root179]